MYIPITVCLTLPPSRMYSQMNYLYQRMNNSGRALNYIRTIMYIRSRNTINVVMRKEVASHSNKNVTLTLVFSKVELSFVSYEINIEVV